VKALDTNTLVRFLLRDDARQAEAARGILSQAQRAGEVLLVPLPVVLELIWVLSSVYHCEREAVIQSLEALLSMPVLRFHRHELVSELCRRGRAADTDLDDLLIGLNAEALGCDTVLTFDKAAARSDLFTLV
jgi:predicted nucleic-acid-binding protein